jgi:hypothetical protein
VKPISLDLGRVCGSADHLMESVIKCFVDASGVLLKRLVDDDLLVLLPLSRELLAM